MKPDSPQNMKRCSRRRMNELWILLQILRRSVGWVVLISAILALLFFVLIELQRILSIQNRLSEKQMYKKLEPFTVLPLSSPHLAKRVQPYPRAIQEVPEHVLRKPNLQVKELSMPEIRCSKPPYLLILVVSAPRNFEQRNAIRKSWANPEKWAVPPMSELESKTVFLVGNSSKKFNLLLKNENHKSKDILFGDYMDSYKNLTPKVMHGFSWAEQHCQPSFILKTNDNCFVNVPQLVLFLANFNTKTENLYAGQILKSVPVPRKPEYLWYVTNLVNANPTYEPYASGFGYLLSGDVLKKLVAFSSKVHVFPAEDAYIGTVLKVAGVEPTSSTRFFMNYTFLVGCNVLHYFVLNKLKTSSEQMELQGMANDATFMCSEDHIVQDWM